MLECNENCPYKEVIEDLKKDSERNSAQHREFYDKFMDTQTKIAISEERYTNLLNLMMEVKTTVNELKDKPAKRWDNVVMYIITGVVGIAMGFLFKVQF